MNKKPFWTMKRTLLALALILTAAICSLFIYNAVNTVPDRADSLSIEEAEKIVNQELAEVPLMNAKISEYIAENTHLTVKEFLSREKKKVTLSVSYETLDAFGVYEREKEEIWLSILKNGSSVTSTQIGKLLEPIMLEKMASAEKRSGTVTMTLYQTGKKTWMLYRSDEVINACLGSVIDIRNDVNATTHIGDRDISKNTNYRNAFSNLFALSNYDNTVPDTSAPLSRAWHSFYADFYKNFIKDARWEYLADGLLTTLEITGAALVLGVLIGFFVAVVRATYLKTKRLLPLDLVCRLYLTVIRGTPLMVQLLIIYFVLLLPIGIPKFWAAVLCFGFNSGAYVAEIVRGGIMSIDEGQSEAGRSLGFNYVQTMIFIVIPQAFKNVLPALANEFIVLLKESSVAFYIGVADLTQGGLKIRSLTYSDFLPLIAVALIYLVVVVFLSYLVSLLERRLRKSDR